MYKYGCFSFAALSRTEPVGRLYTYPRMAHYGPAPKGPGGPTRARPTRAQGGIYIYIYEDLLSRGTIIYNRDHLSGSYYIHIYMYIYICLYIYIFMYIYICGYIHTYRHILCSCRRIVVFIIV